MPKKHRDETEHCKVPADRRKSFFTAYDATMSTAMLALCADGAKGDIQPTVARALCRFAVALTSLACISKCRAEFSSESDRDVPTEGNTIVIQTEMSGPIPVKSRRSQRKGKTYTFLTATFCGSTRRQNTRLDAYWDNTVLNSIQASAV